jgi:antitoxin (DNA-binding transcriptional repressor) of toxin-antitoxin stability system
LKIDFKSLTMMELRSSPGEILDRVARDGEVFVIERNGQPRACLVPVSFLLPDVSPERISDELKKLNEKAEQYRPTINEQKELTLSFRETVAGNDLVLDIILPHGYPDSAPRLYAPQLPKDTPHRWQDGALSIFGVIAQWNPKTHDVVHTLNLARVWLKHYAKWRKTGDWPERMDTQ